MAQYQITVDAQMLQQLFFGEGDAVRRLMEQILNQVLEAQAHEQIGAGAYERTERRVDYRNGYKPRQLTTRVGKLHLRVPQLRNGKFSTELFQRYQRSEQALVLALMEMVINGVSTRDVARITEELCGTEFARSTVSDLCQRLDPIIQGWNDRDLSAKRYPFLLVDAMVIRAREDDFVTSCSLLVAIGIGEDGRREILGMKVGDSESEASWSDFFQWLKARRLHGVDLVVSDEHSGLVKAVRAHFQGCLWQRCQTHFMRNILDAAPKALKRALHAAVRGVLEAPDLATSRVLLADVLTTYEETAPRAMAILERGFDDATVVLRLPQPYHRRLRTTNAVERLNGELRRRERVIRIFPNRASALRLLGALAMELNEDWLTERLYLNMTDYWTWRKQQRDPQSDNVRPLAAKR